MIKVLNDIQAVVFPYWPMVLAGLVTLGVGLLSRWRRWAGRLAAPGGAAAGWAAVSPGVWHWALWPRSTLECLVLPAAVFVGAELAGLRVRSRWLGVGAAGFVAWWLARSPGGRAEFWRVWFGAVFVALALRWLGAGQKREAVAVGLIVAGALVVGGAPAAWVVAAGVVPVVGGAVLAAVPDAGVAPGLLMVGVVGAVLGGGRAMRGGVGVVELGCLGAMISPLLVARVAAGFSRRFGRAGNVVAVFAVSAGVVGVSWILSRAIR